MTNPAVDPDSERALMEVMRQLNLAMALVAEARDKGRPSDALSARIYLRAAVDELVKISEIGTRSIAKP